MYAKEKRRRDYLQTIAQHIAEKFPCRLIFIQEEPESDCLALEPNEELVIRVGKNKLSLIPFLVIPRFIPDLPIYLIWGQDPTLDTTILPYLGKYATRLIFDLESDRDLAGFAKRMLLLMEGTEAEIMDIDWAYSGGWRDVLAKVFCTAESVAQLRQAKRISIFYNSSETQAVYLQAWLKACLGTLGPITLIPDTCARIEIQTPDREYILNQQGPKVTVHITTENQCELPFTLPFPDFARRSVFMREIFYQTITGHYKKMLREIG